MVKIKFYIPDGHLEKETLRLLSKAGFSVKISVRGYTPEIDDDEIGLKILRPQDFPLVISMGKGDLGIVGADIIQEFKLTYPEKSEEIVELVDLKFGKVKLVAAVSEDAHPNIKSMNDFLRYAKEKESKRGKIVVVSEYPRIAEEYLKNKGIFPVFIKPAGKTEAWVVPPNPEGDMIVDTAQTGTTLLANKCRILDTILVSTAKLITSKSTMGSEKKKKIMEIVQLFKIVLEAEEKVNVYICSEKTSSSQLGDESAKMVRCHRDWAQARVFLQE